MSMDDIRKRDGRTCKVGDRVRFSPPPPGAKRYHHRFVIRLCAHPLDPMIGESGKTRNYHPKN
jgi:hypothetical protein